MKKDTLPNLPYGEGSFYEKENGTVVYRKNAVSLDGVIKRLSVSGSSVKECITLMRKKEREFNGTLMEASTLADEMNEWLCCIKKPVLKEQSFIRLKQIVKRIEESPLGALNAADVVYTDLQYYINGLISQRYSYSSIKKYFNTFNDFFRFFCIKNQCENPTKLLSMPRRELLDVEEKLVEFFGDSDIKKFIKGATDKYSTGKLKYKYGPVLAANLFMGLRVGELLALTWKDVDFDAKTVYVCKTAITTESSERVIQNSTKKYKNRYVPINSIAFGLLKDYKDYVNGKDDELVLKSNNGKVLNISIVSSNIHSIECKYGLEVKYKGSHIMRHTCASLFFRNGVPIEIICSILGNSREVCERTYVHFIEEQRQVAAKQIEGIELRDD